MDITILLTCCLGDYMTGTIKCFKENGYGDDIRVVGVDVRPMLCNFVGVDSFYQVPRSDDPAYLGTILEICMKEHVDVVIPLNTMELIPFENAKSFFADHNIKVMTAGTGLNFVNDKESFALFCKAKDIPSPLQETFTDYQLAKEFVLEHDDITLCCKKPDSCGARGFHVIGTPGKVDAVAKDQNVISVDALQQIIKNEGRVLIQEYLPGDEYTVDILAHHGRAMLACIKKNSCMENGVAMVSEVVDEPSVLPLCVKVVRAAMLDGNVGFDLKLSADGTPYIIDVNPRLTATVSLCRAAGLNLPYLGLRKALQKPLPPIKYPTVGWKCYRRIEDHFIPPEGVGYNG